MSNVNYHFDDETVIVTGASAGIGREIALAFGKAGATVINGDIQPGPKIGDISTHELIRENGGRAEYVETDVSQPTQLSTLVDRADEYGGLNIFVNNAGTFKHVPFLETEESELDKHYQVNTKGTYFGCRAAAEKMSERGGAIVNVASISSCVTQGGLVHYEATKGAVKMITQGVAFELAEYDIRVNAVAPGIIPTELYEGYSEKYQDKTEREELVKPIPMNRPGKPEEIARAALFLASDEASYTTGHLLFVDGGWMVL